MWDDRYSFIITIRDVSIKEVSLIAICDLTKMTILCDGVFLTKEVAFISVTV